MRRREEEKNEVGGGNRKIGEENKGNDRRRGK